MQRKWWTLIVVSVATFMLLLDITVVNTALPAIHEDLGASFTELQWVIDAYTLSLAALVLTAGVLATFAVCRHENRLRFVMGDAFNATATAADADLLRANLGADDLNLRVMIATALGRTLGTKASADLRPLLDDAEDILRVTAAEIMVEAGDPAALRTLGKLLESRHIPLTPSIRRFLHDTA